MDTHCWIVENLSGGRHLRQMLFTRFIKYIKSLAFNKRLSIRTLFNVIKDDVRSTTGSNIRTILLETMVDPRELKPYLLREWVVHPPQDEWTVPLLRNLLEVLNKNWEVVFDEETGDVAEMEDVEFMIGAICSG